LLQETQTECGPLQGLWDSFRRCGLCAISTAASNATELCFTVKVRSFPGRLVSRSRRPGTFLPILFRRQKARPPELPSWMHALTRACISHRARAICMVRAWGLASLRLLIVMLDCTYIHAHLYVACIYTCSGAREHLQGLGFPNWLQSQKSYAYVQCTQAHVAAASEWQIISTWTY
jgi:hypothetical protein